MEKKRFHSLLQNYSSLNLKEAQELINLEKEYPYSQVLHFLAARSCQDNQLTESEHQLHMGALYATDRSVFKSLLNAPRKPRIELASTPETQTPSYITESPSTHKTISEKEETEAIETSVNKTELMSDAFYEEVMNDLQTLKRVKHEFEITVERLEHETESDKVQKVPAEPRKNSKSADRPQQTVENPAKKQEQNEIIDNFIKTQPSIKPAEKIAEAQKSDLSEKSLIHADNIVSETLAEILIRQGKKEKAIEVLKKLIWKFPQKKAYFAAQIEELKKK